MDGFTSIILSLLIILPPLFRLLFPKIEETRPTNTDKITLLTCTRNYAEEQTTEVLKNISSISDAEKMAENICREIDSDVEYGDKKIKISVSIGISLYPFNGTTFEELFDKASKD